MRRREPQPILLPGVFDLPRTRLSVSEAVYPTFPVTDPLPAALAASSDRACYCGACGAAAAAAACYCGMCGQRLV